MSIQSELDRISTAKAELKSAIESKGVSVPENTSLSGYGDLVEQIQQGGPYLPLTGGTLSGNLTGKYITGTWLQATAITDLNAVATRFAVIDGSGWLYYRSAVEMLSDLGVNDAIQAAIGNAMAASY